MATSKPYADPTDERVDSVDTLLGGARALSKSSDEIMTAMAQDASLALSLQCNRDLKSMVKLDRKGTRAAKVLHSLRDDTVPTVIPPTLSSIIDHTVRNTYTDKMTNLRRTNISERQRELHGKNRASIIMNLGSLLTRIGGMHALPVNSIRRGLENKYLGMPTHLWNMSRAYREVPGEPWVDAALAEPPVRAWYPPPREPLSDEIDLSCRDNLEWYRSVKFARHKDGSKLENELLHTVTGEHFYIPKSLAELRTRKARAEAQAENGTLDPLRVATEARIYYNKVMRRTEKRPKKILEHKLHPKASLGMYYLCFWSDVGYADQDVEEWKPADYAVPWACRRL